MRVPVVSLLILVSSFYVSCSNNDDDPEGPPTNRRRINEEISRENVGNGAEEQEVIVDEPFFDEFARSLINDDESGAVEVIIPPEVFVHNWPIPRNNRNNNFDMNAPVILPRRFPDTDTDPDAGFPFTQPSQSSLSSSSSASQLSQAIPLTRLRHSDYEMSPSFGQPSLATRLNTIPQASSSSSMMDNTFVSPGPTGTNTIRSSLLNEASPPFPSNIAPGISGVIRLSDRNDRTGGVMFPSNRRSYNEDYDGDVMIHLPRRNSNNLGWPQPVRIPSEAIHFDTTEVEFFNIIRRAETETSPPQNSRYYGEYVDPDDGTRRYLSLPILNFPGDEEDKEFDTNAPQNQDDDETKEEDIIDDVEQTGHASAVVVNDFVTTSTMQTPPRGQSTPVFARTPDVQTTNINYSTPNILVTRKSYCTPPAARGSSYYYDSRLKNTFQLSPGSFLDHCEVAEAVFAQEVTQLTLEVQRHTSFPDQETLFERIPVFSNSSHLDDRHLRAFELDFAIFYKLVAKCPSKYFLPAMALSLQYDQDFPKFLKLYFTVKSSFDYLDDEFQRLFLEMFLNMRTISNSAFEFFSSRKNSVFFFSDFSTYPCFYGKFSPCQVAEVLSKLDQQPEAVFPGNPLRQFILDFDYSDMINSFHSYSNFSKSNFVKIFSLKNLFRSEDDFNMSVYKLFKFANDNSQNYSNTLSSHDMVRKILKMALKHQDFSTIESLFLYFDLEILKNDEPSLRKLSRSGIPHFSVQVRKINKSYCTVRLTLKKGNNFRPVTLILPLF